MNNKLGNKQYIFEDDRPFPNCNASTLAVLRNGDVIAAWFGGLHEKSSDVEHKK
jgi:predicted neuraminidase